MALTPAETAFLESQHSAAMITTGEGGIPKAVRVGVALVDGRLWSSGTQSRVRIRVRGTAKLRPAAMIAVSRVTHVRLISAVLGGGPGHDGILHRTGPSAGLGDRTPLP
jgi:hypothetical protein